MKIQNTSAEKTYSPSQKGRVSIDPNPIREREMLDKDGNVINPRTKQIIRYANQ